MIIYVLIIVVVIGYLIGKRGGTSKKDVDNQLSTRNQEWYSYIKSFKKNAKDKSQNKLVDDILADVKRNGLVALDYDTTIENTYEDNTQSPETANEPVNYQQQPQSNTASQESYSLPVNVQTPQKPKTEIQLDNASLLLYLGAFIFVASVGLFVAFGDFGGYLKTFIVLLLAITLYGAGIGLFRSTKKFTQVGVAFAAIGMAMVPFVGLAAYLYVFDQSNGAMVWFVTSVLCLTVYAHALIFFKNGFLNYVFIFTLLSLFESSVSITTAPIYYYGWAMAFLSIVLAFIATYKNIWPSFKESTYISGQLLVPLSVIVSLALVPAKGSIQMGISLLLAAAFYGLQTVNAVGKVREGYGALTHVLVLGAILWLGYGFTTSFKQTAIIALIINTLQLCVLLIFSKSTVGWKNFASVLIGYSFLGALLAAQKPILVLIAVLLIMVINFVVWIRQNRLEGYVIGMGALMTVPIIIGQLVVNGRVTALVQSLLLFAALVVQWAIFVAYRIVAKIDGWRSAAKIVLTLSFVVVILSALVLSAYACLGICLGIFVLALLLAYLESDSDWAAIAGAVIAAPVLHTLFGQEQLLVCLLIALTANILIALKYRKEFNRWLGSVLWLLVPVAMGNGVLGEKWSMQEYAYAYMLSAIGLIFARGIARGVFFVSSKVPMISYAKSASVSYVVGYCFAIAMSVLLALFSKDSQVLTTALLTITLLLTIILARYIEKDPDLYGLVPIISQAILISALRPSIGENNKISLLVLLSSVTSITLYFAMTSAMFKNVSKSLKNITLGLVFFAPLMVFYYGSVWAMPVAFIAASIVLYYHFKDADQSVHELIGGLGTIGILWLMWQLGVRETQAFSHVIVALFAGYAVWRYRRGEKSASNQYVLAMLITATVPLALQAIGGAAGGLYGWWLLLEQIAFIAIGMFIGNKIMIQWGLYVAVATILYQLRGLGWAALAFLGVFVIALAAYQIQRINKN